MLVVYDIMHCNTSFLHQMWQQFGNYRNEVPGTMVYGSYGGHTDEFSICQCIATV